MIDPLRNLDGLPNASSPPSDATNGMEPDMDSVSHVLATPSDKYDG